MSEGLLNIAARTKWGRVALLFLPIIGWLVLVMEWRRLRREEEHKRWALTVLRGVAVVDKVRIVENYAPRPGGGQDRLEDSIVVDFTVNLPDGDTYATMNTVPAVGGKSARSFPPGSQFYCLVDRDNAKKVEILPDEPAPANLQQALEVAQRETPAPSVS